MPPSASSKPATTETAKAPNDEQLVAALKERDEALVRLQEEEAAHRTTKGLLDVEKEAHEDTRNELNEALEGPETPASSAKPWPDTLILTVSEHAELTPAQQSEFRAVLGTVTSDPA